MALWIRHYSALAFSEALVSEVVAASDSAMGSADRCQCRIQRQIRNAIREQTGFGAEQRVRHPVALPSDVLDVLRKNGEVQRACLKRVGSPDRIPASWFTASQIHLNNDKLPDLVVMSTSD